MVNWPVYVCPECKEKFQQFWRGCINKCPICEAPAKMLFDQYVWDRDFSKVKAKMLDLISVALEYHDSMMNEMPWCGCTRCNELLNLKERLEDT